MSKAFVKGFWPMLYDKGKPKSENRQQAACFAATARFAANWYDVAVSRETQSERKIGAFTAMLAASRLQFAVQTELESVRLLNF